MDFLPVTGPDALRLLTLPGFAWAALSDYHTRRVDPRLWPLLIGIGTVASIWQILQISPLRTVDELNALNQIIIIPLVTGSVAIILHRLKAIGGADAKALFTLGLVFPTAVQLQMPLWDITLPLVENESRAMIVTIVFNTLIIGIFYPVKMWVGNLKTGNLSLGSFSSKIGRVSDVERTSGKMKAQNKKGEDFILDLDAVRMYLRWRGESIQTLLREGRKLRDPKSITTVYNTKNGAIKSNIDLKYIPNPSYFDPQMGEGSEIDTSEIHIDEDPWGAELFLDSIDHHAYGTTPDDLRDGLDYLHQNEMIQILPGFPMIIPLFIGLVISLTFGDIFSGWLVLLFA